MTTYSGLKAPNKDSFNRRKNHLNNAINRQWLGETQGRKVSKFFRKMASQHQLEKANYELGNTH